MNHRRKGLLLALVFGVAVIIVGVVPSTLAYIMAKSDTMVNTFTAPYFQPDGDSALIAVHKTVDNMGFKTIGPEGFHFALYDEAKDETIYMTTDETGYASVLIPFSDADIGKSYTYRLSEVNDGREEVTYSEVVYTVTISVTVNTENDIVTELMLDGQPVRQIVAEFENVYGSAELPHTGDDSRIALYALLLLASCAGIIVLIKIKNRAA